MNTSLIIYVIGYALSAIISLGVGLFVWLRNKKKLSNISFFLTSIAFSTFSGSYLLAVTTADPYLSRFYLLFTLANLFTVCFSATTAFAMFNLVRKHIIGLSAVYIGAFALLVFYLIDTSRYVLVSVPYAYFPNFYNKGEYYWLFTLFFGIVFAYFFFVVLYQYFIGDDLTKKRVTYFMTAFGWAYIFGSIGFLPIFHIDVNLLPSVLMGLYTIPLAYGILKYDLLSINVFAEKAFIYAVGTVVMGLLIIGVNVANNVLVKIIPGFSVLIIPFFSGLVIIIVSRYIWGQLKFADALKYEFINTISHKFRTPLTHIRWIAEELREAAPEVDRNKYVDQIQYASMRLFELTNMVMDVAHDEVDDNFYRLTPVRIGELIETIRANHEDQIARKKLHLHIMAGEDIPEIQADRTRLKFAFEILFENALIYTKDGGTITISIQKQANNVYIIYKDSGIGIDAKELPFMFSKFYRTMNARRTDTEGMGIGLYIARNIITKHHGQIWAESEGVDKGSTFNIVLPIKN